MLQIKLQLYREEFVQGWVSSFSVKMNSWQDVAALTAFCVLVWAHEMSPVVLINENKYICNTQLFLILIFRPHIHKKATDINFSLISWLSAD